MSPLVGGITGAGEGTISVCPGFIRLLCLEKQSTVQLSDKRLKPWSEVMSGFMSKCQKQNPDFTLTQVGRFEL
jgi:hypothetical protein